jgi:hypothetical protein
MQLMLSSTASLQGMLTQHATAAALLMLADVQSRTDVLTAHAQAHQAPR